MIVERNTLANLVTLYVQKRLLDIHIALFAILNIFYVTEIYFQGNYHYQNKNVKLVHLCIQI